MTYESDGRGTGVVVAVVIILLLGFFVLLCMGLPVFLLFARTSSVSVGPPAVASPVASTTASAIAVEEAYEDVTLPAVHINAQGNVSIAYEEVQSDLVEDRLRSYCLPERPSIHRTLDVVVEADCPEASFVSVMNLCRELGIDEVHLMFLSDSGPTDDNEDGAGDGSEPLE